MEEVVDRNFRPEEVQKVGGNGKRYNLDPDNIEALEDSIYVRVSRIYKISNLFRFKNINQMALAITKSIGIVWRPPISFCMCNIPP